MAMSSNQPKSQVSIEPIPNSTVQLGEGPHWDVKKQSLYYVDIYSGTIHRYDYAENKVYNCKINNEGIVSFIIPAKCKEDTFVVGIERRIGVIQWDGLSQNCNVEKILFTVETEPEYNKNRFNDAKADPFGRLYAGTMRLETLGEDLFKNKRGNLYRFQCGKTYKKLLSGIGISNGLAWNVETNKMYYIDSIALNIVEFVYNSGTGDISNPRAIIDFKVKGEKPNFVPDGMTIDKSGLLYMATYGGSKILIIDPKNGKIQSAIKFPCEQITSCAFGGPNLDILFVTTSQQGGKPAPAGTTYKVTGLGAVGREMKKAKF